MSEPRFTPAAGGGVPTAEQMEEVESNWQVVPIDTPIAAHVLESVVVPSEQVVAAVTRYEQCQHAGMQDVGSTHTASSRER